MTRFTPNLEKILAPNDSMIHDVSFIPTRERSLFLSKPVHGDLMQIPARFSRIPEGLLLFPCRSRVAVRDLHRERRMARRDAQPEN